MLKNLNLILLFSLLVTPVQAKDKPYYSLGGKYLGVGTDDGYFVDYGGMVKGYITDDGYYLNEEANPAGYVNENRILNINNGQPLNFDYNND